MQTDESQNVVRPESGLVLSALGRRSFATLATTSPAGHAHVAGVMYELVRRSMYVNTLRSSRKARNVAGGAAVAVCVPVRRLPIGAPSSIQFQAAAQVLDVDHPEIRAQLDDGHLGSLTGHGELDLPGTCFVRIDVPSRLLTYGLGMSLLSLIRDPLSAGGVVELEPIR